MALQQLNDNSRKILGITSAQKTTVVPNIQSTTPVVQRNTTQGIGRLAPLNTASQNILGTSRPSTTIQTQPAQIQQSQGFIKKLGNALNTVSDKLKSSFIKTVSKTGLHFEANPQDARNYVMTTKLWATNIGKKVIKLSVQAEQEDKNIRVDGNNIALIDKKGVLDTIGSLSFKAAKGTFDFLEKNADLQASAYIKISQGKHKELTDDEKFAITPDFGGTSKVGKTGIKVAGKIVKGQKVGSIIEDIKTGFEGGRKIREQAEIGAKGTLGQRARTELIDRLTPIFDFVNKAAKQLPTEVNPYRKMRLLAGVSGKVEAVLDTKIAPILKTERKRLGDLSALLILERERELVARGLTRRRNTEQITRGISELKTKYGEKSFGVLQESADKLRSVGNEMLDMLHRGGIIDDASYASIKKNNQFYAPMEAIEYIADNLEKGRFGAGNSFNVASQDVIRGIKSFTGEVGDPIEALVRKIPKVIALTEKNTALKSLVDLRKQYPNVYEDLIVPISGDSIPRGMGMINLFENGKNVRYAVPEIVESAIKNLDAESANLLIGLGSIQAKILRAGATGLNVGFIPVNIVRDIQDALTTELTEKGAKAMFQFLASYPRAIFSAAGKGKLYQEWAKAGGLQSTMTEQIFKRTPKAVAELSGKKNLIKTIIKSPKTLIEFANRVGEQSTRLARFSSGVKRGETVAEAAFRSRDISLDFAKAGNKIKVLNQIIPFLNAGIQGSEKIARLYKNNPKAAIAATGTIFGVPTVALYNYNSQFKDFNDIPSVERQNNWIMIARDRTPEEKEGGEKIIGIKIPKGFLGRIVANTLDASMDFMREKDPKTFAQAALETTAGISPIGLPFNKEELGQTLSTILPPWLQAGIEGVSNTNLYFGSNIVPRRLQDVKASEQFRKTTPEVYKKLGKVLNISPLILENTVNTTTGGLGRQLAELASGNIEKGSTEQIARRFSGIRGGKESDKEIDEIFARVAEGKTESLAKKREAEDRYEKLKAMPKEQAATEFDSLIRDNPKLAEEIVDIVGEEQLGLTFTDRAVKQLGVENGDRAKYLVSQLNKLKSNEEKKDYFQKLLDKKIITEQVAEQIVYLLAQ